MLRLVLSVILFTLLLVLPVAFASAPYPPTGDMARPLVGGYQIEMWKEVRFWFDSYRTCTLAFPVYRVADGALGVVTAGHCNKWDSDGWNYEWVMYQPAKNESNSRIGPVEATACTVDATLVMYDNVYPGVLHIYDNGSYETLEVVDWISWDEVPNYLGYTFYKTGRTTGTTSGTIFNFDNIVIMEDCAMYKVLYTTIYIEGGDSGGPLYAKLGGQSTLLGYFSYAVYEVRPDGSKIFLFSAFLSVDNLWDAFGVKPYVCQWC